MSKTILDGARMGSRAELHDALAAAFSLPTHYGRNLDALWDCLTEQREGTEVILTSPEAMPEALFAPLAALFLDLARTGCGWRFSVESPTARPGRYRHFKGNEYQVLGVARHSETEEEMVVYRALYGEGGLWVRPAAMWLETVTRDGVTQPRFTYIGE